MFDIQIKKLEISGIQCYNKNCKHNPQYNYNIIGSVFHIKKDTIVAIVSVDNNYNVFCRDCIDDVFNLIRSKMDSQLWAFQ